MIEHKIGNIYQINPELDPQLGGQYIVATEIKHWGIQGYLLLETPDDGSLFRYEGKAYIRKKYEQIVLVGFAEWMSINKEEKDE